MRRRRIELRCRTSQRPRASTARCTKPTRTWATRIASSDATSEALHAYEQALKINPDTPHAIEYQGEAFLGLNRIDEARFNFLRLYALDQQHAAKLLQAMQAWVEANKAKPPAGIDVPALAAWIAEKAASLKVEMNRSW